MLNNLRQMLAQRRQRSDIYCTAGYWDGKAEQHSDYAVSMWANNNLNHLYHDEILGVVGKMLPFSSHLKVLDVGCGTGRMSRWFAQQGARVVGIDFSAKSIELARRHSESQEIEYRTASVFDLDENQAYELLFSWGSLTFACRNRADLERIMARLFASLKPGGNALFLEPVHSGFLHRVLRMDIVEFTSVMREAGFRVVAVEPMHFWPARLALAFIAWPRWITTPVYFIGQALMKLPGLRKLGDYWAIRACKD